MRILATSRQYVYAPPAVLAARAQLDQVDLAFMPDDGTVPGGGDWRPAEWLTGPAGRLFGAGLLVGPGAGFGALPLPPGAYMVFVREHLADGEVPVMPWTRLTVGLAGPG